MKGLTKKCRDCKKIKPYSQFRKNILVKSGYINSCNDCRNKYEREHHRDNYDREKAHLKAIKRTLSGKSKECTKRMQTKYPEKYKARYTTKHAIKSGLIEKRPCEICNDVKSECHHPDYSKPLEVRWLCKKHHMELHRKK